MTGPEPVENTRKTLRASRRALASIDALLAAAPSSLTIETRRLRGFMRVRRLAYYTVLLPFGMLSRRSPLLVLLSAAAAGVAALVLLLTGGDFVLIALFAYWGIGGLTYHAFSVRMAALVKEAADSVEMTSSEVLAAWGGRRRSRR